MPKGRPVPGLALAVAAWMRYVGGIDETGGVIDVRDPLAQRLKGCLRWRSRTGGQGRGTSGGRGRVSRRGIAADPDFREAVSQAYEGLCQRGARAMVAALTAGEPN